MSLRDLVTGSDACTASDGAGPSNAMGALVNNLLGGAAKTQEQLRELPGVPQPGFHPGAGSSSMMSPEAAAMAAVTNPGMMQVPGLGPSRMDTGAAQALAASIAGPAMANPAEWDAIFGGQAGPSGSKFQTPLHVPVGPLPGPQQPILMPPDVVAPAVGQQLKQFFSAAARTGAIGGVLAPPALNPAMTANLSVNDRCRIRDRATILARHVFAEQGNAFADQQVNNLLASMHIHPHELPAELPHAHDAAWHEVWAQQQGNQGPVHPLAQELAAGGAAAAQWDHIWQGSGQMARPHPPSTGWADEFVQHTNNQQQQHAAGPEAWANEFHSLQQPGGAWAEEFTADTATASQAKFRSTTDADAMDSTRKLVDVLSRDADPKMRNSKFLQFVSKMSKGELMFEDNKVVERPGGNHAATSWVNDFTQQQGEAAAQPGDARWADEFARTFANGLDLGNEEQLEAAWREQLAQQGGPAATTDGWVQEFNQAADEDTFKEWERLYGEGRVEEALGGASSMRRKGEYVFAQDNPFLGDEQALAKGKDLFRRGVLSEAALALEAVVTAQPNNADAWRLLGTVHAENDDDQQAIAAMLKALEANPRDPDVLLALGVSHVNELDLEEAVQHLATWLGSHPQYGQVANEFGVPPDSSQRLSHTVRMFQAASKAYPQDAELAVALGVLHHLARQYHEAIDAFRAALQLRPQDYSLWNKLGATLANNARSSEAIQAYQKALDLKPNYMRAWTNMGISFANLGEYNKSARFYVRALALNPGASHVWGYLRTSLVCAGQMELMPAVDEQRLDTLAEALPLE